MEDPTNPVICYPEEFSPDQPSSQVSHYPIVQPTTYQPPPVHHRHDHHETSGGLEIYCVCLDGIVSVGILCFIIGLIGGLPFLLISLGSYAYPEFALNSVSISPFNLSNSDSHTTTTTNWNISLHVRNPDRKASISYDMAQASLSNKKTQFLSPGSIPAFLLGKKDSTLVKASLAASSVYMDDTLRNAILDCMSTSGGAVDLTLKMGALVRFHPWKSSEVKGSVWVSCKGVKMEFLSNSTSATMVGGSRNCEVVPKYF
ncbi:hypothetical protein L1049_014125 [Liquidambar formosana]|uniref:Late embryogenesis abundant protein LEA-2 subgroup domain-containing protein n=1 Tax=Liquidambar formosana TaxID=63359 RepID=A0AAP0WZB7_LIQFO